MCSLFTRKLNARELKKEDESISHQTENEQEKFVNVSGTYIPRFVVTLADGVQPLYFSGQPKHHSLKDRNRSTQEQQQQ